MSTVNVGDPVRIISGHFTGQVVKVAEVSRSRGVVYSYRMHVNVSQNVDRPRTRLLRYRPDEVERVDPDLWAVLSTLDNESEKSQ